MTTAKLQEILVSIGLSEQAAKVYLTMLMLGPSPVLKISRASEVKRTTVYSVIDQLKEKGLARTETRGFKKLFAAEAPQKLEMLLENQKQLFKSHLVEFEKIASQNHTVSEIRHYEGLAAIQGVYRDILNDVRRGDDYMVLSDRAKLESLDKDFIDSFEEKRASTGANIRLILQDSETARHSYKFQKNINAEIKLLPEKRNLTTNLIIVPGKVFIHQLTHPTMGVLIENENIINMHKEMFEVMWGSLPE